MPELNEQTIEEALENDYFMDRCLTNLQHFGIIKISCAFVKIGGTIRRKSRQPADCQMQMKYEKRRNRYDI